MIQYITAREAAEKWNISQRRVSILCAENRIPDVAMLGNMWIIPRDAEKPDDARKKPKAPKRFENPRPFVKWAGGKGQLLEVLKSNLPKGIGAKINKYAEPFVGGGALLFALLSEYSFDEVYICDNNKELINAFSVIKKYSGELIQILANMQAKYSLSTDEEKQKYYYEERDRFNALILNEENCVEKAALFIFINRTCFNGLYRVNRKGCYNVPFGKHTNPTICDTENLIKVSESLQNVIIRSCDYHDVLSFVDENTFVYIDPPYRPLNATSGFTSYTEEQFNDQNQIELAEMYKELSDKGAKVMLSNSDPHNVDENDNFFDDLYGDFNIQRVEASRMINSKASSRGKIKELLVKNY